MSLQGSLDTFALPDVLVLLASTKKSGELHVAGNRGPGGPRTGDLQGLLWLDEGRLVGHDVARAADGPTAVFELLRLTEGSFSFVAGAAVQSGEPQDVEPVLAEAQGYLTEWREIEKVVPSLAAWLELAAEAPAPHVSMRAEQWRLIVGIGGGCSVSALVDRLGQGELSGCRAVKELVEAGLVSLAAEPTPAAAAYLSSPSFEPAGLAPSPVEVTIDAPAPAPEPIILDVVEERAEAEAEPAPAPAEAGSFDADGDDGLVTLPPRARRSKPVAPEASPAAGPARDSRLPAGATLDDIAASEPPRSGRLNDAHALARQLASLGDEGGDADEPIDPAAVAAAVAAGELPPGVEGLDGDEPLNRGLLLKFLSSVRN